jgi:hypothetical protein
MHPKPESTSISTAAQTQKKIIHSEHKTGDQFLAGFWVCFS